MNETYELKALRARVDTLAAELQQVEQRVAALEQANVRQPLEGEPLSLGGTQLLAEAPEAILSPARLEVPAHEILQAAQVTTVDAATPPPLPPLPPPLPLPSYPGLPPPLPSLATWEDQELAKWKEPELLPPLLRSAEIPPQQVPPLAAFTAKAEPARRPQHEAPVAEAAIYARVEEPKMPQIPEVPAAAKFNPGEREAQLAAWWATRVGATLAVIGVVFFGVYVSLHTPPWVKFLELVAIAGAVTAAGGWLERRARAGEKPAEWLRASTAWFDPARLGEVVLGSGLALFYFCAYAAQAVPAVRVLEEVSSGVLAQLVVVAGLIAVALWRRSPGIATMATGLGLVTAVFSSFGGLVAEALVAAFFLGGVAVGFYRSKGWAGPAWVALPGAYGIYLLVAFGPWAAAEVLPARVVVWGVWAGLAVLFFMRDAQLRRLPDYEADESEHRYHNLNSALALAVGALATARLYPQRWDEFAWTGTVVWLVLGLWRRWQVRGDAVGAVLLVKASGLLVLGILSAVEGRTVALVLLVQAGVMRLAARWLDSRGMWAGSAVVGALAGWCFYRDTQMVLPLAWVPVLGTALFVLGWTLWLGSLRAQADSQDNRDFDELCKVAAVVGGVVAVRALFTTEPVGWGVALGVGLVGLLAVLATVVRAALPLVVGGVVLGALQLYQLRDAEDGLGGWVLGINGAVLVLADGVAGWAAGRWENKVGRAWPRWLGHGLWACALVMGAATGWRLVGEEVTLAGLVVVAAGFLLLAPVAPTRQLPWLAAGAVGLGLGGWLVRGTECAALPLLLAVAAVLGGLPLGLAWSRWLRPVWATLPWARTWCRLIWGGALVVWANVLPQLGWPLGAQVMGWAGLALGGVAVARWGGVAAGLELAWAAWALTAGTLTKAGYQGRLEPLEWKSGAVLLVLAAWAAVVWVRDLVATKEPEAQVPAWPRQAVGVQVAVASGLIWLQAMLWFSKTYAIGLLLLAVVLAVGLVRRYAIKEAGVGAAALLGWVWLLALGLTRAPVVQGFQLGLAAVWLAAATVVAVPLWLRSRAWGQWLGGCGALFLVWIVCGRQHGVLAGWATLGWGLGALGLFLTGLFGRVGPYRWLGLLGFGLAVARAFAVDLNSALDRILAFVVLGLGLLWVGFSYQRFRHLVVGLPEEPGAPDAARREEREAQDEHKEEPPR